MNTVSKTEKMADTIQKVDSLIVESLSKRRSKGWGKVCLTFSFETPSAFQGAISCTRLYQGSFNRKEIRIVISYHVYSSGEVARGNPGLAPRQVQYSIQGTFSKRKQEELSAIMSEVFDAIR